MKNATSMESSGSTTELQEVRQGCVALGRQAEDVAELVLPLLRQATQELGRLETQREELRKTVARETSPPVLIRLTERIEEQGQQLKRLERASRGLKELVSGLGGLSEQLQAGLARHEEAQREREAISHEEKRMWLRELGSLREQVRGQDTSASPAPAQQEELQRLRSDNEAQPRLRAERERLAHRVTELEKELADKDQTLAAKEQTIADLRRMIVLLTGDAASPKPEPKPLPAPVSVGPVTPKAPAPPPARPRAPDQMFGSSTMQLAHNMLETLGGHASLSQPPVDQAPPAPPPPRVPSMEIMLGPLDELEAMPPSLPPPVPIVPPIPVLPSVQQQAPGMPRASARPLPLAPAMTPAPVPSSAPRVHGRPGTLVISEDMFNEMLVEERHPGAPGKK
jgi:hypothetical protein